MRVESQVGVKAPVLPAAFTQCRSRPRGSRMLAPTPIQAAAGSGKTFLLDYGAGNVRSVRNACRKLGFELHEVRSPSDIGKADRLLFPGVGACGQAMAALTKQGYVEALKDYLLEGRPYLGICLGLQLLFEGSDENGGLEGLGIIPGRVSRFSYVQGRPVPQIGWNTLNQRKPSQLLQGMEDRRVYFVNSYRALPTDANDDWVLATSDYGGDFVSVVQKGEIYATQFHPEKSGTAGLDILRNFLAPRDAAQQQQQSSQQQPSNGHSTQLAKRVVVALDVRSNDNGDLVVTKGDQYDVREGGTTSGGDVRNLGKPVTLAERYFAEGADEVSFLNITGFRDFPLEDLPMLEVLQLASENIFVPLTVGGGIRSFTDANGIFYSALEIASEYFRSGADKVSIGSDAVDVVQEMQRSGKKTGSSSIEQISWHYGAQAVVVSIDPRRVYVSYPAECSHQTVRTAAPGPNGEEYCWWQCTVRGGREGRDIDAITLAQGVEALGAGEIMLNCIDRDGTNSGFDVELVKAVSDAVTIPVIASSGAGCPEHFTEVLSQTNASAALAAGIFHREEVAIEAVKKHMAENGVPTRLR